VPATGPLGPAAVAFGVRPQPAALPAEGLAEAQTAAEAKGRKLDMGRFTGWVRDRDGWSNRCPGHCFQRALTTLKLGRRANSDMPARAKIFILRCPDWPETSALKMSDLVATMPGAPPLVEAMPLSRAEVERAILSLSDGEKTALVKIARVYARKRNTP
jgi:hypothetical protein